MKNKNKNVVPKKKEYLKPTMVKHEAASKITGSASECNYYVSTSYCTSAPYYY
jgi:hypothetical protein